MRDRRCPAPAHERDPGSTARWRSARGAGGARRCSTWPEQIGPRPRARGARRPHRAAAWSICARRSSDGAAIEIVTARDPVARRGDPPLRRARDGGRREAPLPGRADRRRPHRPLREVPVRLPVERPFTPDDLEQIEAEMTRILAEDAPFAREVRDARGSAARSSRRWARSSSSRASTTSRKASRSRSSATARFADLCRGPHVQRADQIGAVKLLEAAGSYWRGDERNPMLQRIYGTAFAHAATSSTRTSRGIEEAKRRDHRRVGAELDLFHLDPLAPGSPFYLPKGMVRLQRARRLHALALPEVRLPGGDGAAGRARRALQDVGPLRRVPRRHVLVRRATRARSSASSR